jgi:hypothetical protein
LENELSLDSFIAWLYATPLSTAIRDISWVIPTIQSAHIVAIAAVVGAALITDLRLAGVFATDEAPATIVRRYAPWTWGALLVLLLTGLVMSAGEPDRVLVNSVFWFKMGMVVTVSVLTWLLHKPFLNTSPAGRRGWLNAFIKPAAWFSLLLWTGVIICGRWIAYAI